MPSFIPKRLAMRGHKVRYEDIHMRDSELPDWLEEALMGGTLSRSPERGGFIYFSETDAVVVPLGLWIMQRPDGTFFTATDERLASDYTLSADA